MIASTVRRVSDHTDPAVNAQIAELTRERVARCAAVGRDAIERRLRELDHEWDIERTLEANAAAFAGLGVALASRVDRRWWVLPAVVAGFLMQHAVQGWCPPLLWLRRMGFRTASEIDHERYALKALRGDFAGAQGDAESALSAAAP